MTEPKRADTVSQGPSDTPTPTAWRQLTLPSSPRSLLRNLLESSVIPFQDWEDLPASEQDKILCHTTTEPLLNDLAERKLLSSYQVECIRAGRSFGLVLGNYRVLDRLGTGGMGTVYRAEHMRLRKQVAIKVRQLHHDQDPRTLLRFFWEMQAVAQLHHPNIVSALDAGEVRAPDPDTPALHYLVMEYVPGEDLESFVKKNGPLPVARACDLIYQVACALDEAHKNDLIHRDIKPSNIMVTPEGQAKLLDFGLARHVRSRLTQPGALLGTIDYIAPEQARDASSVDIRADIYSLGCTFFWSLTGRTPFPPQEDMARDLIYRLVQPPRSVRTWRPEVPQALDEALLKMLALNRADRFPTPQAVLQALRGFLSGEWRDRLLLISGPWGPPWAPALQDPAATTRAHQVLIVDEEPALRTLCRKALQLDGIESDEAADGREALLACQRKTYDLILLDINMPGMSGLEVLRQLRENPPSPHLKIVMVSGHAGADEMAQMLPAGVDDYLTKPWSLIQLRARTKAALRLKDGQERSDLLHRRMLDVNSELERNLTARNNDLTQTRNALVLALAKLVGQRTMETGSHLIRLQRYSRCLAEEAAASPVFKEQIDAHFVPMLECCVPLHDIGKVSLPDHILLKPGKLAADERLFMQTHTVAGAQTLKEVAAQHGSALVFLQTAIDIARHHHERFDGTGYPDGLGGTDIPLPARMVGLADAYDALRSKRSYRPALSHAAALQVLTESSPGQFDPHLLTALQRCAPQFERFFRDLPD